MASSGDRRWATARRGGMTVLGKVAVPKPINLPSQRLENHGLDPNVEIVPKGALGWGSRPSSSASNAWGSSSSPNADSSSNSPCHLSARPSSGEDGSCPSTAGSDKVHDSIPISWSSDSRPSSASGALTSGQASLASLRPCSAEPRPGSSQLSRFAEPPSDISVTWTRERLVVTSSENDGFSLSTGDFPSLGSVKSSSGKNSGSRGSADGFPLAKECPENHSVAFCNFPLVITGDASLSTDGKTGTDDSCRRDKPLHGEGGSWVGIEKLNAVTPPYGNSGILPQHFNAWHGTPLNNPAGGIWYRGPSGGPPPYGGPVPPSGLQMESFHSYCPQISASTVPIPSPGTMPRGLQPKSGDMYSPQLPDAYIHPGLPARPGVYPAPVPYDGYFCPPMGYCRPNDQNSSIMGMAGGPSSICGQFPSQNVHDAGNSQITPPGHGSSNRGHSSEEVESGHHDPREPYRVLLKPHVNCNEKSEVRELDSCQRSSGPSVEKVHISKNSTSWENEWRVESRKVGEKELEVRAVIESASSQNADRMLTVKSPENLENARFDGDHARVEQKNFVAATDQQSTAPKDSSLIQKIKGPSAKAQLSGLRPDVMFVSDRPEEGDKWQVHHVNLSHSPAESGPHPPDPAKESALVLSTEEKVLGETAVSGLNTSRSSHHGGPGKARHCHQGRGRFNPGDVDGFQKKSAASDPLLPIPSETSDVQRQTCSGSQPMKKYEGGYVPVASGLTDSKAEHINAREQKAKAQAILKELNKRTLVVEGSNSKIESGILDNYEDLAPSIESKAISKRSASSSYVPISSGDLVPQSTHRRSYTVGRSSNLSRQFSQRPSMGVCKESAIIHKQSVPVQQDAEFGDAVKFGVAPYVDSSNISEQFQTGYKQKQNMVSEKNYSQKIANEPLKSHLDVAYDVTTTVGFGTDCLAHQRRRSNRGYRNNSKGDESLPAYPLSSVAPTESGVEIVEVLDKNKRNKDKLLKNSDSETDYNVPRSMTESNDDVNQLMESRSGSAHDAEAQMRGGNQWKSQSSRRAPRNQQRSRTTDKFHGRDAAVWTPVRAQNKIDIADETSAGTAVEVQSLLVKSNEPLQSNNKRNKRAEIERHVPKPVAKEMAQGSVHQQVAVSDSQNKTADEAVQQADSGSIFVAVKESRNADSRCSRSARGHGSWHQQGTTDTVNLEGLPIGQCQLHFSQMSGNVQKVYEDHQGPKPEEKPTKDLDGGLSYDGLNIHSGSSNLSSQFQVITPAVRNEGIPVRGKCQPSLKEPKGGRYSLNPDRKKSSFESVRSRNLSAAHRVSQTDTAAPEVSQTDATPPPRDNHSAVGQSTLRWQPKSVQVSCQNSQANRAAGDGQNTAQSGGAPMEEASEKHDEACDQSASVKDNMCEEAGQSEINKKERKPQSFVVHHQSIGQVPLKSQELAKEKQEAGFSLEPCKNGNRNTRRFSRGAENRQDWNSSRQDTRQYNVSAHWERQRFKSNYKYQPIGAYNDGNKLSQFEGSMDGSQTTDPRYNDACSGGSFYERKA